MRQSSPRLTTAVSPERIAPPGFFHHLSLHRFHFLTNLNIILITTFTVSITFIHTKAFLEIILITLTINVSTSPHQVWFQNRRAKWRRQEKMEAARLGLHDYQLGGLRFDKFFQDHPHDSNNSRPGLGLESWPGLAPLSTLSHALPGFLSHPQVAKIMMVMII